MAFWGVARTETWRERTAERFLQQSGFACYLPLMRARNGRSAVPLFPNYLFVELDELGGWRAVDNAIGVVELLRFGEQPAKLPAHVVPTLRGHEHGGLVQLPKTPRPPGVLEPKVGDRMLILRGSFAEHLALYAGALPHHRVAVLLELLGRQVRVELGARDLRPL